MDPIRSTPPSASLFRLPGRGREETIDPRGAETGEQGRYLALSAPQEHLRAPSPGTDSPIRPKAVQSGTRFPNFDLLRLVAASAVLFSHSFGIVEGNERSEPLVRLLGHGNILGLYGVYTFFIISGFLITKSFQRSGIRDYFIKRCLRIFPGLVACSIVTTAVALWATGSILQWDALQQGVLYVARTILLYDTSDAALPGVIFSQNDFGRILNGSLWSLGPEVACYIAVAALGVLGMVGLRSALVVLAVGLYAHLTGLFGNVGFVLPFFAAGAVFCFWRDRPAIGLWTVACAVQGLLIGGLLGYPTVAFALFGSWLIISFATGPLQIPGATRFGDLSFGMYLYGWPIEQALRFALGAGASWWLVLLLALPLSAAAAMISWRLVEEPSLRFVPRSRKEGRSNPVDVFQKNALAARP